MLDSMMEGMSSLMEVVTLILSLRIISETIKKILILPKMKEIHFFSLPFPQ